MQNLFTLKEMERMDAGLPPWESMSFACGGWLQFYMFGVGKALQESGLDKGVQYAGCSAGALTAAGLALEGDFDAGVKYAKEECITVAYKSLAGLLQLHVYVGGSTDNCLLPFFTKEKANRVQFAATSAMWMGAHRLKDFESKEDFKSAILASCAAFPAAKTQVHKGILYLDGGVSDFQPVIDDNTVTVSPFYFSNVDIKPSRYVPLWWAFLPPNDPRTVDWLYSLGYEDCLQYIKKRKILDYMNKNKKIQVDEDTDTLTLSAASAPSTAEGTSSVGSTYSASGAWDQIKAFLRRHRAFWNPTPHPYDKPNKVSVHRFLGYDLHTFSNYYVSFALDLYLLLLLLVVWKPLALSLIYCELFLRIVYLNTVILLSLTGVFSLLESLLSWRQWSLKKDPVTALREEWKSYSATGKNQQLMSRSLEELSDCLVCVFSLSLVLRFFSGRPTPSVELRKHDRLAKHSLLYRVFRHII